MMTKLTEISIIVPIYNTATTLETCIQSILKQDFLDWEAILVDDGSSDNSYECALNQAKTDSRIKVFKQEHQGVSAARNLALTHAQGEYICFVDADDTIEPNYISSLYAYREFDMVICGYFVDTLNQDHQLIQQKSYIPDDIQLKDIHMKEKLQSLFQNGMIHINCNKLLKTSIIKGFQIVYENHPVNEDYIFMTSYLLHARSICTISSPLYHWQQVTGQVSGIKSLPDNLLSVYNKAHILTREFFQNDQIADKILYYSYYFVVLKYLTNLSRRESNKKLKELHKNNLVKASYNAYCPTSPGEKFIHWLQKKGYFRCYYILYKVLTKCKQ